MTESAGSYEELPHVLVVDDDDRIRALVSRYLNEHGFFVLTAADAGEAKIILKAATFDAMVLDVMMPGQDGVALTQDLRKTSDIPVILLTALGEVDDKITGLQSGADDYLTKPFDPRELVLRLEVILRRRPRATEEMESVQIGKWLFDPQQNELVGAEETLRLTDVEANLLKTLALRAGEVLSREALADLCGLDAGERTIDVQVTRLRKKLEEDSRTPRHLQTVRGKGYVLRVEKESGAA